MASDGSTKSSTSRFRAGLMPEPCKPSGLPTASRTASSSSEGTSSALPIRGTSSHASNGAIGDATVVTVGAGAAVAAGAGGIWVDSVKISIESGGVPPHAAAAARITTAPRIQVQVRSRQRSGMPPGLLRPSVHGQAHRPIDAELSSIRHCFADAGAIAGRVRPAA